MWQVNFTSFEGQTIRQVIDHVRTEAEAWMAAERLNASYARVSPYRVGVYHEVETRE